jgi:hypothetical protein
MSDTASISPELASFCPTHLIQLSELSQAEKETYFDLLIASDAHFHRNFETGEIYADVRILGPGVKIRAEEEVKKEHHGPR